jgi:[ribosomal protein S5]-alanine N-acetyltransferase
MNENPFLPFKNLESERLLLRQMTHADVDEVFTIRSSPELMKYVPRPLLQNKEEAKHLIDIINERIISKEGINWAVTIKPNNKLVGYIGHYQIKWEHFRSEIGYMFLPEVQGKGIATEAIQLLIDYGFNIMKMHSIEAVIDPENIASAKVLEKNGFVKEAHFKENEFYDGKFIDSVIYSIINQKNT